MSVALLVLSNVGAFAVTLAVFALLIAVIVFIHEYGHFSMARACGVRVEVFSIGFGKPLFQWTDRHGTDWRVAWIPLGGYVKFFGDADASSRPDENVTEDRPATTQFTPPDKARRGLTPEERRVCFHYKPVWQRMLIVAAGPFANFALAVAIFWMLFATLGLTAAAPIIGEVSKGSAAEAAGFQSGDEIISVDGRNVETFDDIAQTVILSSNETLTFVIRRDGREITLRATPRRVERDDGFGNTIRAGLLGITSADGKIIYKTFGPLEALQRAFDRVGDILSGTVKFLGRLVQGKEDASQLSGPIKIAEISGKTFLFGFDKSNFEPGKAPSFVEALKNGVYGVISIAGLISVSIGFLNLLPIPVLDGGHLMYYAIEAATGRPLGARVQAAGFRIGLVLLASFMIFVTWNDIKSLFS